MAQEGMAKGLLDLSRKVAVVTGMRRLYAFTGNSFDEAVGPIRAWLERYPQDKHGRHHYDLLQFGLDRSALEPLFEPYRTRYGIPLEDA